MRGAGLMGVAGWLWLWVAAATLACGSEERPPQSPQTVAEAPVAEAPAPAAVGPGDAAAGANDYAMFCASCHGEGGCGDGPLAQTLDPKPARHCDGDVMNGLEDRYLVDVITRGGPPLGKSPLMAAWGGTLSPQQIQDLVAYIRTLADPPYEPSGT